MATAGIWCSSATGDNVAGKSGEQGMSEFSEDDYRPERGAYASASFGASEYDGHPLLATVICIILMFFSLIGGAGRHEAHGSGAELAGYIMGGAVFAAMLWGIAYAITIKRASPGWKIGSLITLIIVGLLVGVLKVGLQNVAVHDDMDAARNQMNGVLSNGINAAPLAPGEDAGPLTRMMATAINGPLADSKAFAAASTAAGLEQVSSFQGLTKTSPVLDHCDKVTALAGLAGEIGGHFPTYVAAARKEGEAAIARGGATQEEVDAAVQGMNGSSDKFTHQWSVVARFATDGGAMCQVLARRHWKMGADGKVLFTDNADLAQASAILARIRVSGAEIERNRAEARAGATQSIDALK